MQVSEARYRATAFLQTLVIPNSVQVREGKGDFHSGRIAVWNLGNFMCPVERYIRVARTRPKPLRFLLLYLQTGAYRWATVGTTILSNGQAHFGSPTDRNDKTGQCRPPSKVVSGPNRTGSFHLISDRIFRYFGLNGKRQKRLARKTRKKEFNASGFIDMLASKGLK